MRSQKLIWFLFITAGILLPACQTKTEMLPTSLPMPTHTLTSTLILTTMVTSTLSPTNTPTLHPTPIATSTREPASNDPSLILDPDKAIAYSKMRLDKTGIRFYPDSSTSTLVRFPNGDQGVFVTMGEIKRGSFQFLYRISNNQFQLVDFIEGVHAWGLKGLPSGQGFLDKADIEYLNLFCDKKDPYKEFLKITGVSHAGTGLWVEDFEIIDISNGKIQVVFADINFDMNYGFEESSYQYQYLDLNDDGFKEIIKTGETCKQKYNETKKDYDNINCQAIGHTVYQFNGTKYVREPSLE